MKTWDIDDGADYEMRMEEVNHAIRTGGSAAGGLTVRDYFAAKAMQGMVTQKDWFSNGCYWKSVEEMTNAYADEAYKFADAMMIERDRKQPEPCSVEEAFGL